VELKVEAGDAGAVGLYERLGMRVVERLGSD
jgi:ribosomal protein S18 acetylase RimI-like enzyme